MKELDQERIEAQTAEHVGGYSESLSSGDSETIEDHRRMRVRRGFSAPWQLGQLGRLPVVLEIDREHLPVYRNRPTRKIVIGPDGRSREEPESIV